MLLYFLGTGAGKPSLRRNVTALVLSLPAPSKEVWLFDCGEGTQHQLLQSPFRLHRIRRIFLTHLHGDHIFGLPGLLGSRSFTGKDKEVNIHGPAGIKDFLNTALGVSRTRLSYPLIIEEMEAGTEVRIDDWLVKTALLEHGIPSFGYRLEEPNRPGKLAAHRLQELGIPPGPIYGRLKQGETVVLANGQVLDGKDFVGPERRGRHLVFLGDTRYTPAAIELALEADLLVHEATFGAALQDKASEFYHSTTAQAAQVAAFAKVGTLVLTHFSSRYSPRSYEKLLAEAKAVFPNTYLAEDHFALEIPRG